MQALRWLNLSGNYRFGPAIFYDEIDPFQGRSRSFNIETTIQPNQHLSQNLEYNQRPLHAPRRPASLVYDVNIVNSKTTYQFDKHFLVRFLAQYDSSAEPRADRLPGVLRVRARHGVPCRVWVAV